MRSNHAKVHNVLEKRRYEQVWHLNAFYYNFFWVILIDAQLYKSNILRPYVNNWKIQYLILMYFVIKLLQCSQVRTHKISKQIFKGQVTDIMSILMPFFIVYFQNYIAFMFVFVAFLTFKFWFLYFYYLVLY